MVIFNSYVKLPEGIYGDDWGCIKTMPEGDPPRHLSQASRFPSGSSSTRREKLLKYNRCIIDM